MGRVQFIGGSPQISAVTFCAKTAQKAAIKNLLGELGVIPKLGGRSSYARKNG